MSMCCSIKTSSPVAATRLYGITFKHRADLQGYSPDMTVYEVFNEDGSALALFLCDLTPARTSAAARG